MILNFMIAASDYSNAGRGTRNKETPQIWADIRLDLGYVSSCMMSEIR